MKVNKIIYIILVLGCLALSSCAGRPIQLDSANQQVNQANIDFTKGRELIASASGFQLLLFIPISINDRHERAFQLLRGQAGNDYITDIKVEESWAWGFVGTLYKTTIMATAYPYKK